MQRDFYEGDEHYEEYLEAQQAIAEGMSIYGGEIAFDDSVLAELAERVWDIMEEKDRQAFGGSIRCWKSEPEESGLWDLKS